MPTPELTIDVRRPLSDPDPPTLHPANTNIVPARPDLITKISDEWPSPAFIKRARTSYGSLFDTSYDPFAEEDDAGRGKRRKRTRLSSTWRYTSRSPSPESEEPVVGFEGSKSPDHVAEPNATTKADGSQASSLEVGLFAGLLADSSIGVTYKNGNLGGLITKSGLEESQARLRAEATPLPSLESPTIQNQSGKLVGGFIEDVEDASIAPAAPLSPPLRPVASDNLLLASPLVTRPVEQEIMTEPSHNFTQHLSSPIENSATSFPEGEHQDLYQSHRGGQSSDQPLPDFPDLQVPVAEFSAVNSLHLEQHGLEDQYGHWQTAIAAQDQMDRSTSTSPREVRSDVRHETEQFYVEEGHEQGHYFENGDLSMSRPHTSNIQQYPDPDDRLPGQIVSSSWGPEPLSAASPYHPIPAIRFHNESSNGHNRYPRSSSTSRSQSTQSAVVDLTEDRDEGERDSSLVPSVDEEEALEEDEVDRIRHSRFSPRKTHLESDDGDSEHAGDRGDAEQSYEDELEEEEEEEEEEEDNYPKYSPKAYRHPADDFHGDEEAEASFDEEDVEESYDEGDAEAGYDEADVENDESPVKPHREPVVIDLLSSDDEDVRNEGEPNPSATTFQSRTTPGQESEASTDENSSDNDGGESAEELNGANDVAFIQNSEPTRSHEILRDLSHRGDDSDSTDEETADDMDNDESLSTAEASADHEEQVGLDQDTEMAEAEHSNLIEDSAGSSVVDVNEATDGEPGYKPLESVQMSKDTNEILLEVAEQEYNGNLVRNDKLLEDQEGTMEIDSDLDPSFDRTVKSQISNASTQPHHSLLLSSISQVDGANDELRKDVPYPSLPKDNDPGSHSDAAKAEPPTDVPYPSVPEDQGMASVGAVSDSEQDAEAMLPSERGNAQLPTPSNTQLSQGVDSQDLSLTPIKDVPPAPSISQNILNRIITDHIIQSELNSSVETQENSNLETRHKFSIEVEPLATETVTEDVTKIRIDEEDGEESRNGILAQVATEQQAEMEQDNDGYIRDGPTEVSEDTIIVSPRKTWKPQFELAPEAMPAPRSSTPVRSRRELGQVELSSGRTDRSPTLVLDKHTTPTGHDASIELAISALESPTKLQHVPPRPRTADVKLRLSRALRTELSDFTALKVLRYHLNRKLDVLAIATTTPPEPKRATKGPRHYLITFNITDPSVAPTSVTEVLVFRPYKEALPIVEAGDGILLRNFQFTAVMGRGFALRSDQNEASSWAVFKGDGNQVETRGPPVEYGEGEKNHILALKDWYRGLDSVAMSKINRANGEKDTGVGKGTGKGF